MPGIANTPGFTHQFSRVGPSFLNDIALIIDTHACLFSFFVLDTLFPTREAFRQVLGNIANNMRLTNSLDQLPSLIDFARPTIETIPSVAPSSYHFPCVLIDEDVP